MTHRRIGYLLLAAGMASNAANFLIQADVLRHWTQPLWSTDWLLSDDSTFGRALHVLIGYSSQPCGMQVLFYLTTLALLLAGMRFAGRAGAPRAVVATAA